MSTPPVIIEIGRRWTKVGVAGHSAPRVSVNTPTAFLPAMRGKMQPRPYNLVFPFLQRTCFANIAVGGATVYYIHGLEDNARWVRFIVDTLTKVFQCIDVVLVPSSLAALHASGCRTGVVVDIGYDTTRCVPYVHGWLCPDPLHGPIISPMGIESILRKFVDDLKAYSSKSKLLEADLQEGVVIENAFVRYVAVSPVDMTTITSTPKPIPARLKHSMVNLNPFAAPEMLFNTEMKLSNGTYSVECDEEMLLPHAVLRAILQGDITARKDLCQNIVVCGGGACIHGILERLAKEIVLLLDKDPRYQCLSQLKPYFQFFCGPISKNMLAYVGCAAIVSSMPSPLSSTHPSGSVLLRKKASSVAMRKETINSS